MKRLMAMVFGVCFLLFSGTAYADLIAYYPFEGNANDATGNGYNGTIYGSTFTSGIDGYALDFTGDGNYVLLPGTLGDYVSSESLTITMWMKPEIETPHINYLFWARDEKPSIHIKQHYIRFRPCEPGAGYAVPVSMNEWSHVAYTWDGTIATGYINGTAVRVDEFSSFTVGGETRIGQDTLPERSFDGIIDDVRIYDHALSSGEIQELYSALAPEPPVANAGPDQTVEQESCDGTEVTLDGSGSTDPDSTPGTNDDIEFFDWYEVDTYLGSGETIDYTFPLGEHIITLVVTDYSGETDEDEVIVIVQDTTPPEVSVSLSKDSLWPPNHEIIDVGFSFEVSDICDPELEVSIEVTSDEPTATAPDAGGPKHAPDAQIIDDDRVLLRAERSGEADGRVYVITVTATDESGNTASSSVSVKANRDKIEEAIDSGQNYDATQTN